MWYFSSLIGFLGLANPDRVFFEKDGDVLTMHGFVDSTLQLIELFSKKSKADSSVILLSDKSRLLLPAVVAAAVCGKTYVPVSPDTPSARLQSIQKALDVKGAYDLSALEVDLLSKSARTSYKNQLNTLMDCLASAPIFAHDKPVYILFTSGSTGQPKGVMIGAHSIKFFTDWAFAEYDFSGSDVILAQVPETFDLSVLDIYAALTFGCKVIGISKKVGSDPVEVSRRIQVHTPTSIFSTPSFFNLLALDRNFDAAALPSLRRFLLCGEVFQKTLAKKLTRKFPDVGIYNLYGPTEATVAVTSVKITNALLSAEGPLPIGRPMGTTECIFLGENQRPVSGDEGEMAFTGDTVGIGYVKMPEKTAEVFIRLKNSYGEDVAAYRTGDLGYLAEDGFLYYRGRNDHQIKWSGHRIELGEIEHQLNNLPYVKSAAILPLRLANGDVAALVAYISAQPDHEDEDEVKSDLAKQLPAYMLPSTYKFIKSMPTTAHGKIDRKALEQEHAKLRGR